MFSILTHLSLSLFASALLIHSPTLNAADIQPANTASSQQESWTINLKGADIREFIDQVAQISGQTFIVDPRVKGQVTVVSTRALGLSEVYQLFLSVMSTHGYSVVTQDDQARIVPNAEAKTQSNNGHIAAEQLETRLIQVQHGQAAELIPLLRPLVPQYGHLAAISSANAIIVSDHSSNIKRIENMLRQIDQKGAHDYSVINLQHAWVMDTAEVLRSTVERGQGKGASATQVIADGRSNRLIITGPPDARRKLISLAQSLDTPSSRSANTRVIRLRYGDAKNLAQTLGELSEKLTTQAGAEGSTKPQNILIRADESLNALVLLADPDVVATLEDIVRQLDVPRAQVMVEAAIVEVSGDISDAVGVQWAIDARRGGLGGTNFSGTGLSVGSVLQAIEDGKNGVTNNALNKLPDGAIVGLGTDSFGMLITALSANSQSNLLSTPSLLTLDNQKAEILVGQNVPFQTGSFTTSASGADNPFTTIERKDIGVTLKVTPHINEGASLRLEIEQEISSIAPTTQGVTASDLITNKRSIKSTILAEDGQVIVLGGLLQEDVTTTESKVPLLGDIPLLGSLFRSSKDTHIKRNLMVFLRPSVVRDAAGMAALSGRKYNDIRVMGDEDHPAILPRKVQYLFDQEPAAAIDLR